MCIISAGNIGGEGSSVHFDNLWSLFHPKLSEPSIAIHHNKQALLQFWHTLCSDCPENIQLILDNPAVTKNIAFNYILADHEDPEVVAFNRMMLPTYYGLLRMCCQQSAAFTRQLSVHQNLQWAFKNITPYTTQYTHACDELFRLMALFVECKDHHHHHQHQQQQLQHQSQPQLAAATAGPATTEGVGDGESGPGAGVAFSRQALQLYLSTLDPRTSWSALISALKILISK